jgi:hypothetical protein
MDAIAQSNPFAAIDDRFVYRGARRQHVAFPLGGIGSGSVSLTGSGRLVDWSIRNRPAIHPAQRLQPFCHQGRARRQADCDARVLNGPLRGIGDRIAQPAQVRLEYGFGANRDSMAKPHSTTRSSSDDFRSPRSNSYVTPFRQGVDVGFQPVHPARRPRHASMPGSHVLVYDLKRCRWLIDYTVAATLKSAMAATARAPLLPIGALSALHFTPPTSTGPNGSAASSLDDRGRRKC